MKAYYLSIRDDPDQGGQIVFAKTAREAKTKLTDDLIYDRWIDLEAHRAKEYDDMENLSDAELALVKWKNGWWWDGKYPDPDTDTDEEFLQWYKEMFGATKK